MLPPSPRPTTRSRPPTACSATSSVRPSATPSPPPGPCSSSWPCTAGWPVAGSPCWAPVSALLIVSGVLSPLDLRGRRHRQLRRLRALECLARRLRHRAPASSAGHRHRCAGRCPHRGSGLSTMTASTRRPLTPTTTPSALRAWLLWTAGFVAFPLSGITGMLVVGRVDGPAAAALGRPRRPAPCSAPARHWPAGAGCRCFAGRRRPPSGWVPASCSGPAPSATAPLSAGSSSWAP